MSDLLILIIFVGVFCFAYQRGKEVGRRESRYDSYELGREQGRREKENDPSILKEQDDTESEKGGKE